MNTLAESNHSESAWKSIRYAAQLFTNWMVFPEKTCKNVGEENSKAVSGLFGLQSICTDQESEVPDLASHLHCKHNEQTVSRSALNPGLTGVWRVC